MTKASYIEAVLDGIDAALRQLAEQPQQQPQQRQLVPAAASLLTPPAAHGPTTSAPDHHTGDAASPRGPSHPGDVPSHAPASPSRSALAQATAGLGVSPPSPSHGSLSWPHASPPPSHGSLLQPHHAGSGRRPSGAAASNGQHGGGRESVDDARGEGVGVGEEEGEAGRGPSAGAGEGEGGLGGRKAGSGSGSGIGRGRSCGVTVKLILSIDRREDEAAAMETVGAAAAGLGPVLAIWPAPSTGYLRHCLLV